MYENDISGTLDFENFPRTPIPRRFSRIRHTQLPLPPNFLYPPLLYGNV